MTNNRGMTWRKLLGVPRLNSDRRAAAALELALILPAFLLLTIAAADFGRFSHTWVAVTNASRSAAGYAGLQAFNPASRATWEAEIRQVAQAEMEGVVGFIPNQLTVTVTPETDSAGRQRVRVAVAYPFQTLVNWVVIPAVITMQQSTSMPMIR
jgi:Flp pilus assembly protein TadG